jgi:hypothetical protein
MENTIRVRRAALALGIALLATLDIGTTRAAEAQASLPPAPLRPDAEMGPTKISVGIWASDISKIDSAAQTFTASLFVEMRWHDTRLAHAEPGVKTYSLADFWHPELLVANDDGSVKRTLPETAEVTHALRFRQAIHSANCGKTPSAGRRSARPVRVLPDSRLRWHPRYASS